MIVTIEGTEYTINPLTVDQAEEVFTGESSPEALRLQSRKLVQFSAAIPADKIGSMPWPVFTQLRAATYEVNGLATKAKSGEDEAAKV